MVFCAPILATSYIGHGKARLRPNADSEFMNACRKPNIIKHHHCRGRCSSTIGALRLSAADYWGRGRMGRIYLMYLPFWRLALQSASSGSAALTVQPSVSYRRLSKFEIRKSTKISFSSSRCQSELLWPVETGHSLHQPQDFAAARYCMGPKDHMKTAILNSGS